MFRALLNLTTDVVALPLDAAVDVVKRVVDPDPETEPSRVKRRLERIEEDLELDD